MSFNEKELSYYIDSLNNEKKPKEHGREVSSKEVEELIETARLVKSLKESVLPQEGYVTKLVDTLKSSVLSKKKSKYSSKKLILSLGAIAAVVAICFTANMMLSFGKNNIVYAMTEGFKEVNTSLEQLVNNIEKAKVKVPFDLEIEKNDQKSVDAGHSPWKLDPVFVSQVFVSLKLSPQGITGDYPIKTEELKLTQKNDREAIVEVSGSKTTISKVYLERLVRQDSTGIWTVVGYDPKQSLTPLKTLIICFWK